MSSRVRVVVLGAGGELGARVCRLASELPGAAVIGASRSARGPLGVPMARADVTDASSVAALLLAGDLVVNCVGPYHYDPRSLLAAVAARRAHYCDLADDVAFAERVRESAAGAHEAAVFACTGASTVPGFVGVLARAFVASPRASEIARVAAYLSVGSANPPSPGLLASLLAPLGRKDPSGRRWFDASRVLSVSDGRSLRFGSYPAPFAGGGVAIGARPVPASFFFGFDRALLTGLVRLASPALGALSRERASALGRRLAPLARLATAFGTPRGLLVVVAEDGSGAELARIAVAARSQGLDIPAAPPVWIAARLARGAQLPSGAVELADLVPCDDALEWLRGVPAYEVHASGSLAL